MWDTNKALSLQKTLIKVNKYLTMFFFIIIVIKGILFIFPEIIPRFAPFTIMEHFQNTVILLKIPFKNSMS